MDPEKPPRWPAVEPEANDVANEEEEESFEVGMIQNALDFEAHDVNEDLMLSFDEFSALVRQRELGEHSDEELLARFEALDLDGSGQINMNEYIRWSLRDALSRSAARVIDLFRLWDEDGSGLIERKEFRRCIHALGFDFLFNDDEVDLVFDDFDIDGSGALDYKELNKVLRQGQAIELDGVLQDGAVEFNVEAKNKHALRRGRRSRPANRALPETVRLRPGSDEQAVIEQLRDVLQANLVRIIDLFREWDEDGNGRIDAKEFRRAIAAMGYDAPREDAERMFRTAFDVDGSGTIEYGELKSLLRRTDAKIADVLQPGAAGAIELDSKNRSGRVGGTPRRAAPRQGSLQGGPPGSRQHQTSGAAGRSSPSKLLPSGGAILPRHRKPAPAPISVAAEPQPEPTPASDGDADGGVRAAVRAAATAAATPRRETVGPKPNAPPIAVGPVATSAGDGDGVGAPTNADGSAVAISMAISAVPQATARSIKTARAQERIGAATTIQSTVRGWLSRGGSRSPPREWRFRQTLSMVLCTAADTGIGDRGTGGGGGSGDGGGNGGGKDGGSANAGSGGGGEEGATSAAHIFVGKHERLDLTSATGRGRMLLEARQDPFTPPVVRGTVVYDSALYVVLPSVPARDGVPLCSLPGPFLYTFTVEPVPGRPDARLELRFARHCHFTESELVHEPPPASSPPPPAAPSPAVASHHGRAGGGARTGGLGGLGGAAGGGRGARLRTLSPPHLALRHAQPAEVERQPFKGGGDEVAAAPPPLPLTAVGVGAGDGAAGVKRGADGQLITEVEWLRARGDAVAAEQQRTQVERDHVHLGLLHERARRQFVAAQQYGAAPAVPAFEPSSAHGSGGMQPSPAYFASYANAYPYAYPPAAYLQHDGWGALAQPWAAGMQQYRPQDWAQLPGAPCELGGASAAAVPAQIQASAHLPSPPQRSPRGKHGGLSPRDRRVAAEEKRKGKAKG